MRYLGGAPLTKQESDALAGRIARHFDQYGFGLWAVEVKNRSPMAGFIGLAYPFFLPEVMPTVEVGWRLARDMWGMGLATEGATQCVKYAFEALGLDEVCSLHLPENVASRRVMEKLGMKFELDTRRPDDGTAVRVFTIRREAWCGGGA
jgi:RimJ/RimL family protein N-acetyltransferase